MTSGVYPRLVRIRVRACDCRARSFRMFRTPMARKAVVAAQRDCSPLHQAPAERCRAMTRARYPGPSAQRSAPERRLGVGWGTDGGMVDDSSHYLIFGDSF